MTCPMTLRVNSTIAFAVGVRDEMFAALIVQAPCVGKQCAFVASATQQLKLSRVTYACAPLAIQCSVSCSCRRSLVQDRRVPGQRRLFLSGLGSTKLFLS